MTINAGGTITAMEDGIDARSTPTEAIAITVSGVTTGGGAGYYGIMTTTGAMGTTTITLDAGAVVSATSGNAIFNDEGDSTTTVNTGASVLGAITLNDGSDDLIFAGGDFAGVTLFDGGDDSDVADGFIDTLTFAGSSGAVDGSLIVNWEALVIGAGSTISFSNNMITVPTTTIASGGTLDATGGGAGLLTINGDVTNDGVLTMVDGAAGDNTTINGDYKGTGELNTDVDFAKTVADVLKVNGDVTGGTTTVNANYISPSIDAEGKNILVVDVSGTSNAGDFALSNPIVGAFAYSFDQIGSDWFLQLSGYNPAVPTYEVLPQVLSGLNTLSSMQQRTGGRSFTGAATQSFASLGADTKAASVDGYNGAYGDTQPAIWARIQGSQSDVQPSVSTSGARFDTRRWQLQAGIDGELASTGNGRWILGVNGSLGRSSADVFSTYGNGSISVDSYSAGLTATWFGDDGLYVDGQAQFSWFSSDLRSATLGSLVTNNDGNGRAFSLELGKRIDMGGGWVITPQAQIMASTVSFDSFIGPNGEAVSLRDGDNVTGRLGINFQRQVSDTFSFHALANVYSQFTGQSQVIVSGTSLVNRPDQWSGEIGVGGSVKIGGNTTLFGEATIATSLENFGESNQFSGIAGVKVNF